MTGLIAIAVRLIPVAQMPAMAFLWLPIGLVMAFAIGLLVGGRGDAKHAVLGTAMFVIAGFLVVFAVFFVYWLLYLAWVIGTHSLR